MRVKQVFPLIPILLALLTVTRVQAQDCSQPAVVCESPAGSGSTANGIPAPIPASFCLESNNSIFFSFTTIDENGPIANQQFPANGNASIQLTVSNCQGDSTFSQTMGFAVFAAPDACDDLTWQAPVLCIDSLQNSFTGNLTGLQPATTYFVLVSGQTEAAPAINAAECGVSLSVSGPAVSYQIAPNPENVDIIAGESVTIESNSGFDNYTFNGPEIDAQNANTFEASPAEVGSTNNYTISTTYAGCEYEAQVVIRVLPAVLPYDVFTPNGDGVNDTWEIDRIDEFPNARVSVYSRWGQRVFQEVNYKNDWDGDDLPPATYYYTIELNEPELEAEPYTGSVTILY